MVKEISPQPHQVEVAAASYVPGRVSTGRAKPLRPARPQAGFPFRHLRLALALAAVTVGGTALQLTGCGSKNTTPAEPDCHVAPSLLNFGFVEEGHSAERSFKIWNEGSAPLHITVGLDCPEYLILEGKGELTIAPTESTWVRIEYRPTTRQDSQCTVDLVGGECATVGCIGNPFRRWSIKADGSGDAPTIQAAIDSSKDGDEIIVGPGTYYENIDFMGNDIVLRSELGPEVTILDGSRQDSSVVVFKRGESRAAVLEGFTIRGGIGTWNGDDNDGAGVFCRNSAPTIRNNIIRDNRCTEGGLGGGIYAGTGLEGSLTGPWIEGNVIEDNEAGRNGGGLACGRGFYEIRDNVFRRNHCSADGAGIWVWMNEGAVRITDNQFWENVAGDHGGGAYIAQNGGATDYVIEGNLFVRNRTEGIGHIGDTGSGAALAVLEMKGEIHHNTIVANDGQHLTECGGGGVLLYRTDGNLRIYDNLIAFNAECGIACWDGTADMGPNLLWGNLGGDLGTGLGECPGSWIDALLFANPLFCDAAADDYSVASDSPAIDGEEVMGAYNDPGCGPARTVPALTTWSRLRALSPD